MSLSLVGGLTVLALIDSTSIGTLVLPIWLMLQRGRLLAGRIGAFLLVVALFYWAMGLALLAGALTFGDQLITFLDTPAGAWVRLLVGLALFAVSWKIPGKKAAVARQEARKRGEDVPRGRLDRWREQAMTQRSSSRSVVALAAFAVLAASAEIPTMLPYLAGIGLLSAADLGGAAQAGVLWGYCLVMIAPAAVLLVVRLAVGTRLDGALRKIGDFLEREAGETIGWLIGIAGAILALRAGTEIFGF
ncbi:GAP family protein [Ruania albidiflava]|uniref:GAP family protein n=1 Tax=Ruania albidiflava TaxID=366586 RepID=UPI000415B783|nr:GAP family protein [Ruania albidiflava]